MSEHLDKFPEYRLSTLFHLRSTKRRDTGRSYQHWTEAKTDLEPILQRKQKKKDINTATVGKVLQQNSHIWPESR
jgi:hypothetical protein